MASRTVLRFPKAGRRRDPPPSTAHRLPTQYQRNGDGSPATQRWAATSARESTKSWDSFSQKGFFVMRKSVAGNESRSLKLVLGSEVRVPGPPGRRESAGLRAAFSQKMFVMRKSVAGNESRSFKLALGSEVRVLGPPGKRASAGTEDSFSQKSIFVKGTSVAGNESLSFRLVLGSEARAPGPPGKRASAETEDSFSQKSIFVKGTSVAGNGSLSFKLVSGSEARAPGPPDKRRRRRRQRELQGELRPYSSVATAMAPTATVGRLSRMTRHVAPRSSLA